MSGKWVSSRGLSHVVTISGARSVPKPALYAEVQPRLKSATTPSRSMPSLSPMAAGG
jgi:hypothetical protein